MLRMGLYWMVSCLCLSIKDFRVQYVRTYNYDAELLQYVSNYLRYAFKSKSQQRPVYVCCYGKAHPNIDANHADKYTTATTS